MICIGGDTRLQQMLLPNLAWLDRRIDEVRVAL
jgi:hypothetical protein